MKDELMVQRNLKEIVQTYFNEKNGFGEHKTIAIQLLKKTIDILTECNINYCLISGTLLGYARHNDFIPWDDDLDLLVDDSISKKLPDIFEKHKDVVVLSKFPNMIRFCFKDIGVEVPGKANGWKDKILNEGTFRWPFIDLFTYKKKNFNNKILFFKKMWDADKFFPADNKIFLGINTLVPKDPHYFLKLNYGSGYMQTLKSSRYSHKKEELVKNRIITMDEYKSVRQEVVDGVDVKILQYESNATNICYDKIDLHKSIETNLIKKSCQSNCILINLEKNKQRYENTVEELKKLSVTNFFHLKGTYGKNKESVEKDLSYILKFLKQFNENIVKTDIKVDEFSVIDDKNIFIQEGPLGCYCSHLRAMIYGYLNFSDYTFIVEDDIAVTNTRNISKYLEMIPDDWDMVFLNSVGKNVVYTEPYYKFVDEFHSGHCYIIRNKCLPFLFKNMYPITDQVDVLISDLHKQLNIYNIEDTVYQKDLETNTQNNLQAIFNSPHYGPIRKKIKKIQECLMFLANKTLPDNEDRNETIAFNLMYDVIYDYITRIDYCKENSNQNIEDYCFDDSIYSSHKEYTDLLVNLQDFIQAGKKGINVKDQSIAIRNTLLFTIQNFKFHNYFDEEYKENWKAYRFGSTANTYYLKNSNIVIKKYNPKLRWALNENENSKDIFLKEIELLKNLQQFDFVPRLLSYNIENLTINLSYCGESLYNEFSLPKDWQTQITKIFNELDRCGVFYPELWLQNILVLNNKITFIDFGLAEYNTNISNEMNLDLFIKSLESLNKKLYGLTDRNYRYQLINTFFNNLKTQ